jgi:hypothetical protein
LAAEFVISDELIYEMGDDPAPANEKVKLPTGADADCVVINPNNGVAIY